MLAEVKNYKAEIGTFIATGVTFLLAETGISHSESAAPLVGFLLSIVICKACLKWSILREKNHLKKEKTELYKKARELQEIAKGGEYKELNDTIEKTLAADLKSDVENIKRREEKIEFLEKESEKLDREVESRIKASINKRTP